MSEKFKYSFDEDNIADLRVSEKLSSVKDGKVLGMVNKGPAPSQVKVTKKSREICAKSLLK